MNLFAIAGLSVSITCILLSAITIYFGRTRLHRLLFSFNLFVAFWGLGCFLAGIALNEKAAILGWKIAFAGGIFIGPAFYHLVSSFCERNRNKLLVSGYTTAAILDTVLISTDYVISNTRFVFGMHYNEDNFLFTIALCFYLSFVILSYYELAGFVRKTRGLQRIQTYYIIIGFLFGFAGANFTFLPMFGIDAIYPFGNFGITLYTFIITFAIFRYRLMDIQLIFKKTLVYSLSAGLLTGLFLLLVIGLTKLFTATAGQTSLAATITAALTIAILFDPLNKKVHAVLERVFQRTKYDYYTAIQDISRQLAITTDLTSTYRLIADSLISLLNLKNVSILSESGGHFQSVHSRSYETVNDPALKAAKGETANPASLSEESPLLNLLEKKGGMVILEDISNIVPDEHIEAVRREFKLFEGETALPVFIEGRMSVIVILGEKRSEDIFTQEDINLLDTVANQSAIAIRNARLYNDLELRVKERTAELTLANEQLQIEIADRVHAEDELKAFSLRLEQSNRDLKDFAHVASHDLQEPLRKVTSFGDRLKSKYAESLGDQGRDYIERMQNAATRMQSLINGLLMYSRVTTKAKPFQQVDLEKIVDEVLSDLEVRIEQSGGRVILEKLPLIEADPVQMRQLLQNLIGNALKFNKKDEPPVVKVSSHLSHTNKQNTSGKTGNEGMIEITVEDNGIGLEEQYADRIFGVFQKLHGRNEYEGTGIGLSVCKKIAEHHGGTIAVKSRVGEGTSFTVTLPVKHNGENND